MTVVPALSDTVQVSTLVAGDVALFTDPNNMDFGPQVLLFTNQGGGSFVRVKDGAVGTLSSEVWVTKLTGAFNFQ